MSPSSSDKKVRLIAISKKTFLGEAGNYIDASEDPEMLIFTGANWDVTNIHYDHLFTLRKAAGTESLKAILDYQQFNDYKDYKIPGIHTDEHPPYTIAESGTRLSELAAKFPHAEIRIVNSVADLATEYRKLIAARNEPVPQEKPVTGFRVSVAKTQSPAPKPRNLVEERSKSTDGQSR